MFENDAKDVNEWKGEPARPGFNPDGSHHENFYKSYEKDQKWLTRKKMQNKLVELNPFIS